MTFKKALHKETKGKNVQFNLTFIKQIRKNIFKRINPECNVIYCDDYICFYDLENNLLAIAK
jgi:hypothetical protein